MSTKTTLKRIALVAVSALSFGLLATAPSNAVVNTPSLTLAAATGSTTVGTAATVNATITFLAGVAGDDVTTSIILTSAPAGNAALPTWGGAAVSATNASVTSGIVAGTGSQSLLTDADTAGAVSHVRAISLTPVVAGTYVVTVTQGTLSATWTLTANALEPVSTTYSKTLLDADATNDKTYAGVGTSTDDVVSVATPVAGTKIGVIQAFAYNGPASDRTAATIFTATVTSGPATVSTATTSDGGALTGSPIATSATAGNEFFAVYSTGAAGTITVEIRAGSLLIGTETLRVYGAVAKLTATVAIPVVTSAAATPATVAVVATDANGNVVPGVALTLATSDATVAAATAGAASSTVAQATAGTATVGVTPAVPAKSGKVTLTFSVLVGTTTISTTADVTVSSATPAKVTAALNKSSYVAGEKATITFTGTDAAGSPVAPSDLVATITSAVAIAGITDKLAADFNTNTTSGSVSYTFFAPSNSGTFSITGTDTTAAAAAFSVSAEVTPSSAEVAANAATDAAAEAIDAANAATDAANLAAEAADAATVAAEEARDAADAATAAIEELATQVATLMAALKAQITTLANTIAKIAKKVKA